VATGGRRTLRKAIGDARKIVVSNQGSTSWRNRAVASDLVEAVTALKNEAARSRWWLGLRRPPAAGAGLLDGYLLVHPSPS
jgi:hypothetical protein